MDKNEFYGLLKKHKTGWIINSFGHIVTLLESKTFGCVIPYDPISWIARAEGKGDFGNWIGGAFEALGMSEVLKEEIADASFNKEESQKTRNELVALLGLKERQGYWV